MLLPYDNALAENQLGACCSACETGAPCCGTTNPRLEAARQPWAWGNPNPPLLGAVRQLIPPGVSFARLSGMDANTTEQWLAEDSSGLPRGATTFTPEQHQAIVQQALAMAQGATARAAADGGGTMTGGGAPATGPKGSAAPVPDGGDGGGLLSSGFSLPLTLVAAGGAAAAAGGILSQEKLDRSRSHKTLEKKRLRSVGSGAGGGAVAGAAIGTMIAGPIGTIIGAVVGGAGGAGGALFSQAKVRKENRKLRKKEQARYIQGVAAQIEDDRQARLAEAAQVRAVAQVRLTITQQARTAKRLAISVRQQGGEDELAAQLEADADAVAIEATAEEDPARLDELRQVQASIVQDLQALDNAAKLARARPTRTGLRGLQAADDFVFKARKQNRAALGLTPQGSDGLTRVLVGGAACAALGALAVQAFGGRRRRRRR